MAGIFRMKDEYGFPVDMACEECKRRNILPDWMEYLADAGSQEDWKFDSAFHEIEMLLGKESSAGILNKFREMFNLLALENEIFIAFCKRMASLKKEPISVL